MTIKKLYCYVDETGQDTKGALFVVSVIIAQKDRDEIVKLLENIERETGKKRTKWQGTGKMIKRKYIEGEEYTNKLYRLGIKYKTLKRT